MRDYFAKCCKCGDEIHEGDFVFDKGGTDGCLCSECACYMNLEEFATWADVDNYIVSKQDIREREFDDAEF